MAARSVASRQGVATSTASMSATQHRQFVQAAMITDLPNELMGALHGIKDKNAKEAAEGAAEAALAAYLMEAGRGHELQLVKGSKLEIELERALYLLRE